MMNLYAEVHPARPWEIQALGPGLPLPSPVSCLGQHTASQPGTSWAREDISSEACVLAISESLLGALKDSNYSPRKQEKGGRGLCIQQMQRLI